MEHTEKELKERIAAELGIRTKELKGWKIVRRSVDARKKEELKYVYTIWAETAEENRILAKSRHKNIM